MALFIDKSNGYGWGGAIVSAGASIAVPTMAFRKLWGQGWFWLVCALLAVLQIPLVIVVHPLVEQFRFGFLLMFGVTDCFVVIAAMYWLCSTGKNQS
jgi:hypothetical protein